MANLFAKKKDDEEPVFLDKEGRIVAQLNKEVYHWLGSRFQFYNRIRDAGKGGFNLFKGQNLEELMEATRSALTLVTRTLNGGLALAFNSTVDAVTNAGDPPEGWPARVDTSDRNNPPQLNTQQDALVIAWMPLKFLNLAKMVRDKGKGLDFYAEGMIKKLYFKVIGYYADPAHWDTERLAFNLKLPEDATLLDVNNMLGPLKSDLEMFAGSYKFFQFGRAPRSGADAQTRNALDDAMDISDEEFVADLHLQNFIISGLEHFIFRYMLTLLAAVENPIAFRSIVQAFEPALVKVVEIRIQFQASFMMEREKMRLRAPYQEFIKKLEARPTVEMVEDKKGRKSRKINYSKKLLELTAYGHLPPYSESEAKNWYAYVMRNILQQKNSDVGYSRTMEILHILMRMAKIEFEAKLKVIENLRDFATEQEKAGALQVRKKQKLVADAKRKKMTKSRKFKVLEQFDMAKTIEKEAEALEQEGARAVEVIEQNITKRKEAFLARAQQMEENALQYGEKNAAVGAAAVYKVVEEADPKNRMAAGMVGWLLQNIQQSKEISSPDLFRRLFDVMPNLAPTQKIMIRKALEGKLEMNEDDLTVSEEELRAYNDQILNRKTEIGKEAPGTLEQKLNHGPLSTTIDRLLALGLTPASLHLVLQMPMSAPQKGAAKLPQGVVQKLMQLNLLMNPFPEMDLVLPNVDEKAPPTKRLNFNRLSKALDSMAS